MSIHGEHGPIDLQLARTHTLRHFPHSDFWKLFLTRRLKWFTVSDSRHWILDYFHGFTSQSLNNKTKTQYFDQLIKLFWLHWEKKLFLFKTNDIQLELFTACSAKGIQVCPLEVVIKLWPLITNNYSNYCTHNFVLEVFHTHAHSYFIYVAIFCGQCQPQNYCDNKYTCSSLHYAWQYSLFFNFGFKSVMDVKHTASFYSASYWESRYCAACCTCACLCCPHSWCSGCSYICDEEEEKCGCQVKG